MSPMRDRIYRKAAESMPNTRRVLRMIYPTYPRWRNHSYIASFLICSWALIFYLPAPSNISSAAIIIALVFAIRQLFDRCIAKPIRQACFEAEHNLPAESAARLESMASRVVAGRQALERSLINESEPDIALAQDCFRYSLLEFVSELRVLDSTSFPALRRIADRPAHRS